MTSKHLPKAGPSAPQPTHADAASLGRIRIQELAPSNAEPGSLPSVPRGNADSSKLGRAGSLSSSGEQRALTGALASPGRYSSRQEPGSSSKMPVSAPVGAASKSAFRAAPPIALPSSSGEHRAPTPLGTPGRATSQTGQLRAVSGHARTARAHAFELVVIAASTGGPPALADFVAALPPSMRVPILIVQHMPASFLETFVERLDGLTELSVRVARGNELVSRDQIWFAPGGRHLIVERESGALRLRLTDSAPVNGCRPSADVTFESAAVAVSGNLIAVVLSGIGRDGRDGAERVRDAGGAVYVQTAQSCAVSEMPEAVRRAYLSDGAFSPSELAVCVTRRVTESLHGH